VKADDFLSVAEELLPDALTFGAHFQSSGYTLKIEPFDVTFPRTPTFLLRRSPTTVFVEVASGITPALVRAWVSYAKSCQKDTRFVVALRKDAVVAPDSMAELKKLGVGLWCVGPDGPYEVLSPVDLALALELPELPRGLKRLLGDAYDQFGRGEWREGFETAAQTFEQQARDYLGKHTGRGRITPSENGKPVTQKRIAKMTMGNLASAFETISSPNAADTRIGQALKRINDDRVTVAHYKGKGAAREMKLRKNVAHNMWALVGALREIRGIAP
jgi:hypothetical protein